MPIRKLRNQTQLSTHSLDIAAQRRNQQISPLLDARDVLLFDPEFLGDTDLSPRSEEHTSELQSLMRISYAVFCLKKKNKKIQILIYNIYLSCHHINKLASNTYI